MNSDTVTCFLPGARVWIAEAGTEMDDYDEFVTLGEVSDKGGTAYTQWDSPVDYDPYGSVLTPIKVITSQTVTMELPLTNVRKKVSHDFFGTMYRRHFGGVVDIALLLHHEGFAYYFGSLQVLGLDSDGTVGGLIVKVLTSGEDLDIGGSYYTMKQTSLL